ncbi:MAG: aminopeptidase P family protein [Chloroflexi bacterium]|nr:aminopeptidase P family protein [Chloroflexota bacterium]
MDYTAEVGTKLERVRALMAEHQLGAVWLRRSASVAWITGGIDVAVNTADVLGVASVVVTPDNATMWTNTIEAPRLQAEDGVEGRGIELRVSPWEQPQPVELGATLGTDFPLEGAKDLTREIAIQRSRLLPVEVERFRQLGGACAEAIHRAINRVKPGNTDHEIAAALSYETRAVSTNPIVVLVGVDDRVHAVRHPLPVGQVMDKYAMLVLCGRRDGLVCSVTRLVHFGKLSDDLRHRMDATADVDAAMIAASRPGTSLEEMFKITQDAYAQAGFADEWKLHHQGGLAGYNPRELLAVPGEGVQLEGDMVCAWNPSITGTKSEDTILVTNDGPEVLTPLYGWPMRAVEVGGMTIERPLILAIE